jgi:hypothetical protein
MMAAPLVAAAAGFMFLWNSHEFFSEKFTLPVRRSLGEGGSEVEG